MAKSLQDQLLGAGLIDKKKAKKINAEKRKAVKDSRKNKTELKNEAAELAQKAIEEEKQRSQELNKQRKLEAEQKAVAAQIKQIISLNVIPKAPDDILEENLQTYNFTDANKVKSIQVSPINQDRIGNGRIAIALLDDEYVLIPAEAANKIKERDETAIVLLNDPNSQEDDEDDPYAEFQVPDDLMW